MVCALLGTIVVGMVLGYMFLDVTAKPMLDETLMAALDFMGFVAGIEIGSNRRLLKQICTPKNLALALALPTGVVIGSLGGAYVSHFLTGLSVYDSILVGSGLGWYSLSSVVISTLYSTELGAVAFLANMLREVSSFVLIPLLARWSEDGGVAAALSYSWRWHACGHVCLYQWAHFVATGAGAAIGAVGVIDC